MDDESRPAAGKADAPDRVIAGRYEIVGVLGEGGAGVVHAARDRVSGQMVAVKSLREGFLAEGPRVAREIAALRLLRIPGVVGLRDEVIERGAMHLVMDLVPGAHFPGDDTPGDWEHVAPLVRSLLETLGRVHAAGVVHRDLKPANVLVDGDGRATLVDFGLSFGPALGAGLTVTGAVVGTPEYLAPEQIRGRGIDGRTDLYALGVMLYQTFSGELPVVATDFADLIRRKLSGSTVPLCRVTKSVPRRVADVIDRLLSVDPGERPQSAAEALRLLFAEGAPATGEIALPRLGPRDPLARVLDAVRARCPIDVHGPRGSGRSRLLADVADAIEPEGRPVIWAAAGRSPYASLGPLLGGLEGLESMTSDQAFDALDGRLRSALACGAVLLADDPRRIDPWSARALDRCRDAGAVVRVVDAPSAECVVLGALTPADLRPLFAGPSRVLHLPEDAADELWRRTGGQPAHIRAEISAWVRHGIAEWARDRVAVSRAALGRLNGGLPVGGWLDGVGTRLGSPRSPELEELLCWITLAWPHGDRDLLARVATRPRWMIEPEIDLLISDGLVRRLDDGRLLPLVVPEGLQVWSDERRRDAHRRLAEVLPRGVPARLLHLAAAGDPREVVAESIVLGRELADSGQGAEALAVLSHALAAARRENDDAAQGAVLDLYVRAALAVGTPGAINEVLYEIGRSQRVSASSRALRGFLHAVLETMQGDPERALAELDACGEFDDEELELWRQSQRARAAERLPLSANERIIEEIGAWARRIGTTRAAANHASWTGALRLRQGRYREAAELFLGPSGRTTYAPAHMADLLNAGSTFLILGDDERAFAAAREALVLAVELRHARFEAYAESLIRDVEYRSGRALEPDFELLDAISAVGSPALEATVCATEAAVAWRAGRVDVARELATRGATIWSTLGFTDEHALARAIEVACGDVPADAEALELVTQALDRADAEGAVQVLGLLAPCVGDPSLVRGALTRVRDRLADVDPDRRGAVLTPREAWARAGLPFVAAE